VKAPAAQAAREEAALLVRAREGDLRAFEALVERHGERVYAVVLRFGLSPVDAEEVVQDVFVRAWRSLDGFQGRARLSTWLYRIAFNEAHRKLNRPAASRREVSLDEVGERFEAVDQGPSPHAQAESAELAALLEAQLRALPDRLRAAVVLRDVAGLSTTDAAAVVGVSQLAFKSRLHRGRKALRRALEPQLAGR